MSPAAALEIKGMTKTFPGVVAVSDLAFQVDHGTVHGLIGQNGCGKSTIVKTLAGYHAPDPGGQAWVDGEPFELGSAQAAKSAGIRFVHQDLAIVEELTALDNVALGLGFERTRAGTVAWRRQRRATQELLDRFGVDVPLGIPLAETSPVERTAVAVVRAIAGGLPGRGLLVLDEPTAALSHREVDSLYKLVREVRSAGTAVLLISHRLDEILAIADTVSVMRNGRLVGGGTVAGMSVESMAALMVGAAAELHPVARPTGRAVVSPDQPVALAVDGLYGARLRGVSLKLHAGEILGVAGVLGSGREELPYALAGAGGPEVAGTWTVDGEAHDSLGIDQAIRAGIVLVPAERGRQGLVQEFTVSENVTLPTIASLRKGLLLDRGQERALSAYWLSKVGVRANALNAPILSMSGGNQQKTVLGRWLATEPTVLVLAEPTAGVDIGARRTLYRLLREHAAEGLAVLVASSDVQDLLEVCDRTIVLRDGRVSSVLEHYDMTEQKIVARMEGVL